MIIDFNKSVLTESEQKMLDLVEEWMNTDDCSVAAYNTFYPVMMLVEQLCYTIRTYQTQAVIDDKLVINND